MTDAVSGTPETNTPADPANPAAPAPVAEVKLPVSDTPPADPAAAASEITEVSYDKTGDVALDMALDFLGKLGIAADHPTMAAATKGEFGMLKAHLATMGDKAAGWEQMVALGEDAFKRQAEAATARAAQTTAIVHEIAGGAEQWQSVFEWAKANADQSEKDEINKLFDSGPMGARAAANLLVDAYRKASGTVVSPKSAVSTAASSAVATSNAPLSPREYAAAVRDLSNKLGNRLDASPEYAALRARFAAYRG